MKQAKPFVFKHFSVNHSRSSMKVGVDGVLVGALAPVDGAREVLDAGCGCGVIALMLAQRCPGANITAIDIDADSVEEARDNFHASDWSDRLWAKCEDFTKLAGKFDVIVSNPPFFRSGVQTPESPREKARHQDTLSPRVLIRRSGTLLTPGGSLTFICPSDLKDEVECEAERMNLLPERIVEVRGHRNAPVKRLVYTLRRSSEVDGQEHPSHRTEELVLEEAPGKATHQYRDLCRDFYLRF